MRRFNQQNKPVFFVNQTGCLGCLLPLFMVFNIFFGWIFFKPAAWLLIEVILILVFFINARFMVKKIFSPNARRDNVIDIKGEVVDEKKELR